MRFKRNKNRFGAPRTFSGGATRPAGKPHKGVYLLPNLFTTAALFCGFYGIVMAMGQQFTTAAVAIFAALVLDSLDGRVARMTNTQSA
ncbi:CDP-alcohol phosphatidyltransferase family protein, partial [Salmonella enterica subsp. enterica]